ncbi:hypothetical protein PFISCL1PPCAC_19068, partial [Pristionchus fissidentatus]
YFQNELSMGSSCSTRSKRSIEIRKEDEEEQSEEEKEKLRENSLYFPVYAQISKKAMRSLCLEHNREKSIKKNKRMKEKRRDEKRREEGRKQRKSERDPCSNDVIFSTPRLISRRSHSNGCAIRDGNTWFICEFHMGYTLLEFADTSSLSASLPRSLKILPFPYDGTDAAAINGSVAYFHDGQLVLHNFVTSQTNRLPLNINKGAIYNSSFSTVDIQSDEHGLWILYREKMKDTLTVSRVSIPALRLVCNLFFKNKSLILRVIQSWSLSLRPSQYCNSFIRCGILHTMSCGANSSVSLRQVFDFYSGIDIVGKETVFTGIPEAINSAQYDPISHSLTIFSQGSIYSI